MTNAENTDYDLSTTGTVVELTDTSSHEEYGLTLDATASVSYVVELRGGTVGYKPITEFNGVAEITDRFPKPEAVDIRVRNTTTAAGETADAILGSGGR
jgi:hypothetical protein